MSDCADENRRQADGDPRMNGSRFSYDGTEPASVAVVEAVSSVSGDDPAELPPLYTAIDPGALDGLFGPAAAGSGLDEGEITFEYAGYLVTVHGHGSIEIRSAGSAGSDSFGSSLS